MNTMHYLLMMAVLFAGFGVSEEAEARRSRREGFNFGTSIRLLSNNDRTLAGEGSDKNTQTNSESQLISPYIGYAFESLNLGLSLTTENGTSKTTEHNEDGSGESVRKVSRDAKGASFFMRFLFGEVFFFEGAGGLYEQKIAVDTETKTFGPDGSFVGDEDSYVVKGVGPGYHLGVGLELNMGGNFFFTSSYQVRMVQLRDYEGGSDLGAKRSFEQKREILFGIAHYHR